MRLQAQEKATFDFGHGARIALKSRGSLSPRRAPVEPSRLSALLACGAICVLDGGSISRAGYRRMPGFGELVETVVHQTRARINGFNGASVKDRSEWGPETLRDPVELGLELDWNYVGIALHHSGNSGTKNPTEVHNKHVDEGYSEIGYHYMVSPTGMIFEGRMIYHKGAHLSLFNTGKIGILMMGDFHEGPVLLDPDGQDQVDQRHLDRLGELIEVLKKEFKTIKMLGGHHEYMPEGYTKCPGNLFSKFLPQLREKHGLAVPIRRS